MYSVERGENPDPPLAVHPDGARADELARLDAHRQIALRQCTDVALVRSRRFQQIYSLRHPLFSIPALGALAHFLVWLV